MKWRRCRIHWWCPKNCDAIRTSDLLAVLDEALDLLHDVYTAKGNEDWFDRRDALFAKAGVNRTPHPTPQRDQWGVEHDQQSSIFVPQPQDPTP